MFFARFGATSDGWGSNDQKTDNRDQGDARRSDRRSRADNGAARGKGRRSNRSAGQSGGSPAAYRPAVAGDSSGNPYGIGETGKGPVNVQMTGGSFPRSFLIPGTDTSIRVGGEIRMSALYWIDGGNPEPTYIRRMPARPGNPPPFRSIASRRPATEAKSVLYVAAAVEIERRNPHTDRMGRSAHLHRIRLRQPGAATNNSTTASTNRMFAISDNISPRLRYAYGTLGPLLFGQANSNFSDPDASVEAILFSGLVR